jgi:hypothetical protein
MQLASMRYVKIDGTAIGVTVASAAEARAALKELRHKKREIKFLRSGCCGDKRPRVLSKASASGQPGF